jgi:hypothetical protein|tara:strand:+ start:225 stop:851 length:627 start_codon:yes stop_codon:yes gene_type:complete
MKIINIIIPIFIIILIGCVTETNEEKIKNSIQAGEEARYKTEYSEAIEYNDAIVGLQTKAAAILLDIENYTGDFEGIKQLKEKLDRECNSILSILDKMIFLPGSDCGMKENLARQIQNWKCCYWTERQFELLEILYNLDSTNTESINNSGQILEEYMESLGPGQEKEEDLLNEVLVAQERFSKKYEMRIDGFNPLDEEFEKATEEFEK